MDKNSPFWSILMNTKDQMSIEKQDDFIFMSSTTLVVSFDALKHVIQRVVQDELYLIQSQQQKFGLLRIKHAYILHCGENETQFFEKVELLVEHLFERFNVSIGKNLVIQIDTLSENIAELLPLKEDLEKLKKYLQTNNIENELLSEMLREITLLDSGSEPVEKQAFKIKLLIERNSNFFNKLPPLYKLYQFVSLHHEYRNTVKSLIKYLPLHSNDIPAESSLFYAIKSGDYLAVKIFLKHGADVHAQDVNGDSSLKQAVKSRQFEIVTLLIKYHANKNRILFDALKDLPMLEHLIKLGVDVNQVNEKGQTVLDVAISQQNVAAVRLLVTAQATITDTKKTAEVLQTAFDLPPKKDSYHETLKEIFLLTSFLFVDSKNYDEEKKYLIKAALLGSNRALKYLSNSHLKLNSDDFAKLRAGYIIGKLYDMQASLEAVKLTTIYSCNSNYQKTTLEELVIVNYLILALSNNFHDMTDQKMKIFQNQLLEASKYLEEFYIDNQSNTQFTNTIHLIRDLTHVSNATLMSSVEPGSCYISK